MTDARAMRDFIRALPKAELHLHLEGTLEPEMMLSLARRNGVAVRFGSVEEVRAAYRFSDLQSFLDIYYEGMGVLLTEQDFFDLTLAYLRRASADGVVHAEIFFDPQAHLPRGVGFETLLSGIRRGIAEGKRELGIDASLILCFLRHLSGEEALETLELALPFKESLVGVGLDSGEAGNPPSKFARAFERARAEGLRVVAHAGEEGPAAYVKEALDLLGAERIDHGVRSVEDPELLRRLAERKIPLTVCPLSNVCLKVVDRLEEHPLRRLMEAGVRVTINSDDPAYFGGYVLENYAAAAEALGLTKGELVRLAGNSLRASFLDEARKRGYLDELERVAGARGEGDG